MNILFEASFTSYYVHIFVLINVHAFPPTPFPSYRVFYLHVPFSFTVHLPIVHNMIPSPISDPLAAELLIGQGHPNQCWCRYFTPNERPAITALHSSSKPSNYNKKSPRENALVEESVLSQIFIWRSVQINL